MPTTISASNAVGFASELAALQLQNEEEQTESAQLDRAAARDSYLNAVQSQVDALNADADATMSAAFVSAAFSAAGGACAIGGAVAQFKADLNSAGLKPDDFSCEA